MKYLMCVLRTVPYFGLGWYGYDLMDGHGFVAFVLAVVIVRAFVEGIRG